MQRIEQKKYNNFKACTVFLRIKCKKNLPRSDPMCLVFATIQVRNCKKAISSTRILFYTKLIMSLTS